MTYIIGLNFYAGDTDLARRQMDAALKGLPAEAILSFEIGNEVRWRCCWCWCGASWGPKQLGCKLEPGWLRMQITC